MEEKPYMFGVENLWAQKDFLRWAEYQDCTLDNKARPQLTADDFEYSLTSLIGSMIFADRQNKWENTREFWIPIGRVENVAAGPKGGQVPIDRTALLTWMLKARQSVRTDPTDIRSVRKTTPFRAFQILCIDLRPGKKAYFYRANDTSEKYYRYTSPEYWERRNARDKWFWKQDHTQNIRRQQG